MTCQDRKCTKFCYLNYEIRRNIKKNLCWIKWGRKMERSLKSQFPEPQMSLTTKTHLNRNLSIHPDILPFQPNHISKCLRYRPIFLNSYSEDLARNQHWSKRSNFREGNGSWTTEIPYCHLLSFPEICNMFGKVCFIFCFWYFVFRFYLKFL